MLSKYGLCRLGRACLTVVILACRSMGKVTTEISHRSISTSRRTRPASAISETTVRNPIESPSTAPLRISESASLARLTERSSRPVTFNPRLFSTSESHVPIGSSGWCCQSILTPRTPRRRIERAKAPSITLSPPVSVTPKRLA